MYRSGHLVPYANRTHVAPPAFGRIRCSLFGACVALSVIAAAGAGCEGGPTTLDRKSGRDVSGTGLGDMNDIDVSVDAALARAGVAPLSMEIRQDGTRVWELRTARDEPGELLVRVGKPDRENGPVPVELKCRVGRFGHPETETLIVKSVAKRLEDLRGRSVYRITW